MTVFRLRLIAGLGVVGLALLLPAMSTNAWSRSAVKRPLPTHPRRSALKLGLCGVACGMQANVYAKPSSEPLSNISSAWRGPPDDPSVPLQGPFPNADDPKPYSLLDGFLAALPMLTLYGGITTWAYFAWYHNQPQNRRVVFNDAVDEGFGGFTYAGGADKAGHFYTTYAFARLGAQILIDRGWSRPAAVLLNVTFTLGLYTLVEIRDGLHPGYGFSMQDYAANILGATAAALLLLSPALDRLFDVRMRYVPSKLYRRALLHEHDIDLSEDYSGQTVMLAFHLGGVDAIRKSPTFGILRYIDLLIGYSTRGFLPKPDPSVNRKQELFVGVSLNLVEVLRDLYPDGQRMGWAAKGLADFSEYVQITPVHKTGGAVWHTPQPYSRGY